MLLLYFSLISLAAGQQFQPYFTPFSAFGGPALNPWAGALGPQSPAPFQFSAPFDYNTRMQQAFPPLFSMAMPELNFDGDESPYCTQWAKNNECVTNPSYMMDSCKEACRKHLKQSPESSTSSQSAEVVESSSSSTEEEPSEEAKIIMDMKLDMEEILPKDLTGESIPFYVNPEEAIKKEEVALTKELMESLEGESMQTESVLMEMEPDLELVHPEEYTDLKQKSEQEISPAAPELYSEEAPEPPTEEIVPEMPEEETMLEIGSDIVEMDPDPTEAEEEEKASEPAIEEAIEKDQENNAAISTQEDAAAYHDETEYLVDDEQPKVVEAISAPESEPELPAPVEAEIEELEYPEMPVNKEIKEEKKIEEIVVEPETEVEQTDDEANVEPVADYHPGLSPMEEHADEEEESQKDMSPGYEMVMPEESKMLEPDQPQVAEAEEEPEAVIEDDIYSPVVVEKETEIVLEEPEAPEEVPATNIENLAPPSDMPVEKITNLRDLQKSFAEETMPKESSKKKPEKAAPVTPPKAPSEPAQEEPPSKPPQQQTASKPEPAKVPSKPAEQQTASKPAPAEVPSKPVQQQTASKPAQAEVPSKPQDATLNSNNVAPPALPPYSASVNRLIRPQSPSANIERRPQVQESAPKPLSAEVGPRPIQDAPQEFADFARELALNLEKEIPQFASLYPNNFEQVITDAANDPAFQYPKQMTDDQLSNFYSQFTNPGIYSNYQQSAQPVTIHEPSEQQPQEPQEPSPQIPNYPIYPSFAQARSTLQGHSQLYDFANIGGWAENPNVQPPGIPTGAADVQQQQQQQQQQPEAPAEIQQPQSYDPQMLYYAGLPSMPQLYQPQQQQQQQQWQVQGQGQRQSGTVRSPAIPQFPTFAYPQRRSS